MVEYDFKIVLVANRSWSLFGIIANSNIPKKATPEPGIISECRSVNPDQSSPQFIRQGLPLSEIETLTPVRKASHKLFEASLKHDRGIVYVPDARIRRTERYNLTRFNIDAEFFIVSTFPDLEKIPLDAITLDNSSFRFRRGKEEMVYGQADVLEKLSRVDVTHGRDAWRSIQVVSRHFELLPILHEKVAAANRQRPPSPLGKLPFPR
ncbi:hypothetical protein PV684_19470 [Streptomyces sp. AK02-04a]|nr:hypothetical protein [Streptomyces sp. AK02-04a]MDX3757598.1 hypothetical protein [Streptomyces sp. AK02-04a]